MRAKASDTVLALLAISVAQPALAQTSKHEQTAEIRRSKAIEEIIVTAQKREERLQDVPISVTVLAGKKFDGFTGDGVNEALSSVRGVKLIDNEWNGVMNMRGVPASGAVLAGRSPIVYHIDWGPFGFIRTANLPDPSPYDLERVEVLRGPQGTLYGANAPNGVVHILAPRDEALPFQIIAVAIISSSMTATLVHLSPNAYLRFELVGLTAVGLFTIKGPLVATIVMLAPDDMRAAAFVLVCLIVSLIGPAARHRGHDHLHFAAMCCGRSSRYALLMLAPGDIVVGMARVASESSSNYGRCRCAGSQLYSSMSRLTA